MVTRDRLIYLQLWEKARNYNTFGLKTKVPIFTDTD